MEELKNIGFYTMSNDRVRNASDSSQMKRCEMIITEYCNFRCPYCRKFDSSVWNNSNIKQMSFDAIKRGIDFWCTGQPVENIRFSGGEPTLHKHIREIVSYASNNGIKRIAISTNGSNKFSLYKELINLGVNDFSISLDGCCAEDVEFMSGGIKGSFEIICDNIERLSKLTYVTVGIVLTQHNIQHTVDIINFADTLGVSDIRVIPSAQYNKPAEGLAIIKDDVLNRHPILKYRTQAFKNGSHVRGLTEHHSPICGLVLDDSVIVGDKHYPCIIAFREHCNPIGLVGHNMRAERKEWMLNHNSLEDPICNKNCLDVCSQYNLLFRSFHPEFFSRK
jgi:molybdenum cofactor biosynthesis enzyme MoaA